MIVLVGLLCLYFLDFVLVLGIWLNWGMVWFALLLGILSFDCLVLCVVGDWVSCVYVFACFCDSWLLFGYLCLFTRGLFVLIWWLFCLIYLLIWVFVLVICWFLRYFGLLPSRFVIGVWVFVLFCGLFCMFVLQGLWLVVICLRVLVVWVWLFGFRLLLLALLWLILWYAHCLAVCVDWFSLLLYKFVTLNFVLLELRFAVWVYCFCFDDLLFVLLCLLVVDFLLLGIGWVLFGYNVSMMLSFGFSYCDCCVI